MTAVSRCGGRNEPQPGDVPEKSIVRYQRTVETKYCPGNPAIAVVGLVAERVAGPPAVGAQLGVHGQHLVIRLHHGQSRDGAFEAPPAQD